jgi:hypothetical protein
LFIKKMHEKLCLLMSVGELGYANSHVSVVLT